MLPSVADKPVTHVAVEPSLGGHAGIDRALVAPHFASMPPEPDYGIEPLWLSEKKAIERAIALCRGNITAAAERLQINPSTIYRKKSAWEQV